jgi:hypothetical protein
VNTKLTATTRPLVLPAAADALDRTMLLMRDDVRVDVADTRLLDALLAPRIVLVADARNLASRAGQSALVATTLLFLRSGASVMIDAPDVLLLESQPPLVGTHLVSALVAAGSLIMRGVTCAADVTRTGAADIAVLFGDSRWHGTAPLVFVVSADALSVTMQAFASARDAIGERWSPRTRVPFGGLAAAGLASGEGFKLVMRNLRDLAVLPEQLDAFYSVSREANFEFDVGMGASAVLLAERLELGVTLGDVDAISGGAITQSALFTLARVPGEGDAPSAQARMRVLEPETSDASNLNRYALLLTTALGELKVDTLAAMDLGGLTIVPYAMRYTWESLVTLEGHARSVLVGVDHIPTRWTVQRAHPEWLGVGATSHHSAMSSEHPRGAPCAWCLHPEDSSAVRNIPTVAFVSHWAGLLLAWRLVRHRLGVTVDMRGQHEYLTPLRTDSPDSLWRSGVASRAECPNRCGRRRAA